MYQLFVSYVYEDKPWKDRIDQWARERRLGDVWVTGEKDDLRPLGEAAVAAALRPKLQAAAALIVLVGADTHNHAWVAYEVNFMQSARKPVVVVRIPNTTGAAPPSLRNITETRFDPDAIRRALGT